MWAPDSAAVRSAAAGRVLSERAADERGTHQRRLREGARPYRARPPKVEVHAWRTVVSPS